MSDQQAPTDDLEPNRFAVRLDDLERRTRIAPDDLVEEQAQPTLGAGAWDESKRQAELAGGA
jgi:hypothetical protein